MTEPTLLNFINSFDQFMGKYAENEYLSEFSLEMYYNLCDIISAMGHCTLSKESFDDLFKDHLKHEVNSKDEEEQMLKFLLQLTDLDVNDKNLSKFRPACFDHNKVYDLLYQKSKIVFKSPQQKSGVTFVYEKSDVLPIMLEGKVLIEKENSAN
ncbi:MAG: hypothetical protein QG673_1638 [Pseudomonadota bacterium]|nr:hypothetical protein [Pseudomonadota bacterium]